ncbi:hypothetical protein PHLCEN_2v2376 [Hermanssonia centrifuga]|uniref:Thioredoxin domain-containing protein n=1 Tax=Hermanssonia centrifuga TaxID=98765 RepID=A0A2R6RLY8_9APHY|nr:hypothetical protein PHLCEN_2v2376 [Hermanssonia centrifuga]
MLSPVLEKVTKEDKSGSGKALDLVTVDTDVEMELAKQYQISSLPTVIAFNDGKPVSQFVGALPEGDSRPVQLGKSPIRPKGYHARNSRLGISNQSRYLKARPLLPTIHEEEDEEYNSGLHYDRDFHRELDSFGREIEAETTQDYDEMEWDEETTLVALLQDDAEHEDDEELTALANKLKAPMSAQGQRLKQYMMETILPVVQRVKQVHETLEDKVDMAYGTGLLAFDEVCKRVEAMALRTEDETKTAHIDSQRTVQTILAELVEAYGHRDQLWHNLEENLGACGTHPAFTALTNPTHRMSFKAERAKAAVEGLPGEVEDAISRIEKKGKDMEKNTNSAASKQKMIKGLLERL